MADFVAVIRRAVDGLSDNNAEMRQKVYEKARGAVRRQLESMNPRPSDELMKRQLDKLEAAITDVESDHAEALPAEEPLLEPVEEVVQEEAVVEAEPAEPHAEPEPYVEPAVEHPAEEAPFVEPAVEEPATEEPVAQEEHLVEEPVVAEPVAEEPVAEEPLDEEPLAVAAVEPVAEPLAEEQAAHVEPVQVEAHAEPSWHVEAEPAADYVPSWHEPEQDVTGEAGAETVEVHEPEPQVFPVHDEELPQAEPVAEASMPATEAQWDWHEATTAAAAVTQSHEQPAAVTPDPLAWEWPGDKTVEPEARAAEAGQKNDWNDLDDLIGFVPKADADAGLAAETASAADAVAAETARAPQRSFRTEPRKPRRKLGALVATVALLAVVGGAGAAYWLNRDAVDDWVGAQVAALTGPSTDTPAETPPTGDTAEGGRSLPAETTPSGTAQTADGGTAANTEIASAAQNGGKFTQRLLTDGSEVDQGPAPALEGNGTEEGKSVAAQTTEAAGVAAEDGQTPAAGGAQTPAGTDTATTTGTQTPGASGDQAAGIGVTQKMFLYEERLGQTGPTAIEGTVAWSTAEESPGGDAKAEPVVRAQINVPTKGLTALVTFRRNVDRSLPASHIIELVFSLPENFEGGGIESVQRVAMKRTEQDRGDALIAVPAKITDDFHMIALNDFPEAIARNTELLRTRTWIDIPITYRNGRRALLTLDKGAAGAEAFDKVMKAWASLGSANSQ